MLLVLLLPLGLIYAVVEILGLEVMKMILERGTVMGKRKKMETRVIHLLEVVRVILIQMRAVVVIVVMMTR